MNFWLRHLGPNEWVLPQFLYLIIRYYKVQKLWKDPGECKSWTLDSGLDHGLDYGLEYGLKSRLIFKLLAMVASHDLH